MEDTQWVHITYEQQYRKCNKPACSTCIHGAKHGPYWYAYWKEQGGRLYSMYVGKVKRPVYISSGDESDFTQEQWRELKESCHHTCLCCGRKEPDIALVADHVIPKSKGGSNAIENIQPLCASCNARKGIRCTDYRSPSPGLWTA